MKNKLHIILFSALLSPSVNALDLSLPSDKTIHPWAVEQAERDKTIRLSKESYLSNGQTKNGGFRFNSDGRNNMTFSGAKKGMNLPFGF